MEVIDATQEWFAQFGTAGWLVASLLTTILVVAAVVAVGLVLIVVVAFVATLFSDEVIGYTYAVILFAIVALILKNKYF